MAKKSKAIKCEKCDLEFPESELSEKHKNKAFVWDGKVLCKDCLVMMGGDPYAASTLWDFKQSQDKASS